MVYVVLVMGRKNIRIKDVKKIARLQCTQQEAAAFLEIRLSQFKTLLAKNKDVRQAWDDGQSLGKLSLRRKQFRLANTNASMGQFLGKNILGQKDVATTEHTGDVGLEIDASRLTQKERNALRKSLIKSSKSRKDAG